VTRRPLISNTRRSPGLTPTSYVPSRLTICQTDAMSIIGVGGLEGALPPAGLLDGILDGDATDRVLPIDGLPVEQYPVDQLPIHLEPPVIVPPVPPVIEPPIVVSPIDTPVDGDPVGIPDPLDGSVDADVEV